MYTTLLLLHSWIRWIALIAGIGATATAVAQTTAPGATGRADRWGLVFMIVLDVQLLIGVLLYLVVSPYMAAIRANFGAAMRISHLRFWAVEHTGMMLAAVALVHLGRALAERAQTPSKRRTRLLVCFALALIAILLATPWPGTEAGRPLFRL